MFGGAYYEVICEYDEEDAGAIDYAFNIEANTPATWE